MLGVGQELLDFNVVGVKPKFENVKSKIILKIMAIVRY